MTDITEKDLPGCHSRTPITFGGKLRIECTKEECPVKGKCGFYNKTIHINNEAAYFNEQLQNIRQ